MRRFLLILGILGSAAFGLAFVISLFNPLLVERAAREVIRIEVEHRVSGKIDGLSNSKISTFAAKALGKTEAELEAAKQELKQQVPQKVANVVADMLNADCPCRKRLVEASVSAQQEKIKSLANVRDRLVNLIETAYASVTASLLKEFRIFTAANGLAFLALTLVTYFRQIAALQLALPAVVLIGAVGITGSLYLFNQNWLHTIVFGQYVGLAYFGYLGLAMVFLADVIFNRARITTKFINTALNLVGSVIQAVPC
jgi:hypothetical protein